VSRITQIVIPALVALACAGGAPKPVQPARSLDVRETLTALAADSMEGRKTATPGAARAARFLAARMQELGLEPAGDSGYFQRMTDSVTDVNVVGILRGSDDALRREAVIVGAHYDHLGIDSAVAGDSIYNGADDDGSGVVAVLGAARELAAGPAPRRTVVFLLTTGEEQRLLGTDWYIDHPVVPLEQTVADLQVEMIGRPDSLAGGPGKLWLTGYERSTMGPAFAAAGLPVVADPRPQFRFFERSDNIAFARRGIPAHTLSSYNLHRDYHQPSDEVERIDFPHLEQAVDVVARAVRVLADGEAPTWNPGGRPQQQATP
jgi:Zn-dependent M28 family amino/carboxypeptidase